jgi:hypothetical protein
LSCVIAVAVRVKWMRGKRRGYKGNFECFLVVPEDAIVVQREKRRKNCFSITEIQPRASGVAHHVYTLLKPVTKHLINCV